MRVATDIGGTFTDLIYLDEATGEVGLTKASTTPHNFAIGVEDTLIKSGINVADTTFFVHGSTIIINALTERKGVKTGLITVEMAEKDYGVTIDPDTLEVTGVTKERG